MAGSLRQFVVTHNGAAQNLGTLFPADAGVPFSELRFTQLGGAAAYIGEAGMGVTATNCALVAPASAAAPQAMLFSIIASKLKLKDIDVLGTNGQIMVIAAVPW